MSSTTLSITNFINVSVATPPLGLAQYATNNLLIFTKETSLDGAGNPFSIYLSPAQVATDWGTGSETYAMANLIFSQAPNILAGNGILIVASLGSSELLAAGIARLQPQIFFGGCLWAGYAPPDAEIIGAAAVVQASSTLLFASDSNVAAVAGGGVFTTIQAASQSYTRCLLYTLGAQQARFMAAAYAGRAMSTNFNGSNTCGTMNLKQLVGVLPDTGITQTLLNTCMTVGADVYTTFGPLPEVFSTGGNTYFDQIYGQMWLQFALLVAGFNALATTATKVPQTEPGMSVLKSAYISVLQQGVINGFIAPGAWNSSNLFGDPVALVRNILQIGWYIYSQPVNQQSQALRVTRAAPLVQIAIKLAGALQSSNVICNINP
jgi:hypothetical protein